MKLIGVAGGSGSGKTTYIQGAHRALGTEQSAVLYQDNYYFDQSHRFDQDGGSVNFDHPDALDLDLLASHLKDLKQGRSIEVPIYDFASHTRQNNTLDFKCKPVIFIDGILIFTHPGIVDALDFKIFIECEENLRFQRRLDRDINERGRSEEGVRAQFTKQVAPMHNQFVEPSKANADLVLSQDQYLQDYKDGLPLLFAKAGLGTRD